MEKTSDRIINRIRKLSYEDLTQHEIADILRISQWTVCRYDPRKSVFGKRRQRSYNDQSIHSQ